MFSLTLHFGFDISDLSLSLSLSFLPAVPGGIIQGRIFNKTLPPAVNFGGLGFIAGHEISHGFWHYLKNSTSIEAHNCIKNQLISLVEPQTGLKYASAGSLLKETIADVGSANASLIAFKRSKGSNIRLPGKMSKFTPEQLFFINSVNNWCHHSTDEAIKNYLEFSSRHPFNYHRAMMPLLNNPGFSDAFNCKIGSRMNPVKKCRLW